MLSLLPLVDLIGPCQQEIGQSVDWVLRDLLAELNEALSQVRHEVVHQVLPDRLRARV